MFSVAIFEILTSQKDFESSYKEFKIRMVDFEHRFANLLCLAFKDCSQLESVFKVSNITSFKCCIVFGGNLTSLFFSSHQLLTIIGPFLERKLIGQIFSHNFFLLQQHFREELETCKNLFRKQLIQVWKETFNMCYKYSGHNVCNTIVFPIPV